MPHTILHQVGHEVFANEPPTLLGRWAGLTGFAVGGSLLYGASLSIVSPGWTSPAAAAWLALSAGLAWCVFIPALHIITRLPWRRCCDASIVTMAFGEVILVSGALANLLLGMEGAVAYAVSINLLIVGFSNVVMAAMLALQLREHGVPAHRTVTLWMLVLNGAGGVIFWLLHRILLAP